MWGSHQERKTYIALVLGMLCAWSPASGLSDKRLCADPECKKIISMGTAKVRYTAGQEGMVSFAMNANIRVISKSAGSDPSLWGVVVNGREGYAPKELILENRVLVATEDLKYEVPVKEVGAVAEQPAVLKASENVRASSVDELTTTRPLEAVNASILTAGEKEEVSGQHQPTGVEAPVEIIEGTRVPMLEDVGTKPASVQPEIGEAKPMEPKVAELKENPSILAAEPKEPIKEKPAQLQEPEVPVQPLKTETLEDSKVPVEPLKSETLADPKVPVRLEEAKLENPKVPAKPVENLETVGDEEEDDDDDYYDEDEDEDIDDDAMDQMQPVLPSKEKKAEVMKPGVAVETTEAVVGEIKKEEKPSLKPGSTANPLIKNSAELRESVTEIPIQADDVGVKENIVKPINTVLPGKSTHSEVTPSEAPSEAAKTVELGENTTPAPQVTEFESHDEVFTPDLGILETTTRPSLAAKAKRVRKTPKVQHNASTEDPGAAAAEKLPETQISNSTETVSHLAQQTKLNEPIETVDTKASMDPLVETESQATQAPLKDPLGDAETGSVNGTDQLTETKPTQSEVEATNIVQKSESEIPAAQEKVTQPKATHEHITSIPASEAPFKAPQPEIKPQLPGFRPLVPKPPYPEDQDHKIETPQYQQETHQHPNDVHKRPNEAHQHSQGAHQQQNEVHRQPNEALQQPHEFHPQPNEASQPANEAKHLQNASEQQPTKADEYLNEANQPKDTSHHYQPEAHQQPERAHRQPNEALQHPNEVNRPQGGYQQPNEVHPQPKAAGQPANEAAYLPNPSEQQSIKADQYLNEANQHKDASHQHHHDHYHYAKPTERTPEHQANDNESKDSSQHPAPSTTSTELPLPNQEDHQRETEQQPPLPEVPAEEVGVVGVGSVEEQKRADPIVLPSQAPPESEPTGLFATIVGTVNSFLSNYKKEAHVALEDDELQRILFPESAKKREAEVAANVEYCEKLTPNSCPNMPSRHQRSTSPECHCDLSHINMDNFVEILTAQALEMGNLLACLGVAGLSTILFLFGYYCFFNSSREGALLAKLNMLERSLLASHKESSILKHDLLQTRGKLSSIEDNSFGSNEMVIALKEELENVLMEKGKLQENISHLERELETAAEAGLELNKIVSELLSNQTGDESIISSVEELQRQLNEQQNTIMEINAILAEKSRENSELQLMLSEQSARLGGEIASLQQDNDELEAEKGNLQTRLEELRIECDEDISKALEGKNYEIKRLQNEIIDMKAKLDEEHTKWQTSLAKVEALEDCLKAVKRDPGVNISKMIDVANVRAEVLDLQKKRAALKERLDAETDGRRIAENQLQIASNEVERLKQDFNQSEKDKLEAQTRLEVLSNYFKDKENQLQKELSLKEAMWLKQQGETISTVDRVTAMQEEIQSLKSQNDALRAEIEAQLAAHKAQTGTLENRAHETWLAARQSERRYEESRAEATMLRRKLTALMGGNPNEIQRPPNAAVDGKIGVNELNNAPSPIHMESPGSPLLGRLPPPPPFLPPPFMGPFMGMPPPPFVPPGEMRPPPLGRLMSPPPPGGSSGGPPHAHLRSGRYTPDYPLHDDDDDDDDEKHFQRRRRWNRDSFSPSRSYRSHSPTDSRYNYTDYTDGDIIYDSETDLSPPPSPRDRRRGSRTDSYKAYSPPPAASSPLSPPGKRRTTPPTNKGVLSSGSERSNKSAKPRNPLKSMV